MADNRLTKKRLKNHFAYNWWKYALSAAVSAMLVSIVFAVTAYRPPAEKKVELYVLNGYIDTETFQRDFWPELQARKPEQEELTVLNINLTDSSNIYAPMQFSTYVAAQQGDLFLISRDEMRRITADGAQEALVELTGYLDSGVIDADGMDLKNGTLDRGDGTTAVYAIPADTLTPVILLASLGAVCNTSLGSALGIRYMHKDVTVYLPCTHVLLNTVGTVSENPCKRTPRRAPLQQMAHQCALWPMGSVWLPS